MASFQANPGIAAARRSNLPCAADSTPASSAVLVTSMPSLPASKAAIASVSLTAGCAPEVVSSRIAASAATAAGWSTSGWPSGEISVPPLASMTDWVRKSDLAAPAMSK